MSLSSSKSSEHLANPAQPSAFEGLKRVNATNRFPAYIGFICSTTTEFGFKQVEV
jgi:hypothetical protein